MIFSNTSNYMLKYQKAKAKLVEYDIPQKDYGNILMDLSNGVRIRSSDYRNFDRLGVFGIAIPPRDEQDEIAEYADTSIR